MDRTLKKFLKKSFSLPIFNIFKIIKATIFLFRKYFLSERIFSTHNYKQYEDYLKFQKEKTLDPERIDKWFNQEWEIKYNGFREIFNNNYQYIKDKSNAICLGARTGQEVKALIDLGIKAIGIDLVPFPPYTIEGDIHNLKALDSSFDFIFTNIFDHSLFPEKFCNEMERVCKSGGIIIIHLQLGVDGDKYSENIVHKPNIIYKYFKDSEILKSMAIKNSFDGMNWELIFKKN